MASQKDITFKGVINTLSVKYALEKHNFKVNIKCHKYIKIKHYANKYKNTQLS